MFTMPTILGTKVAPFPYINEGSGFHCLRVSLSYEV